MPLSRESRLLSLVCHSPTLVVVCPFQQDCKSQKRAPLGTHIAELTSMIVTNAAKATVAGSTKYAEGVADQVKGEASKASGNYTEGLGGQIKGEAKKVQGQAESKAEELKQKL